jgi:tetratricopeptide (TPR) repeat protein
MPDGLIPYDPRNELDGLNSALEPHRAKIEQLRSSEGDGTWASLTEQGEKEKVAEILLEIGKIGGDAQMFRDIVDILEPSGPPKHAAADTSSWIYTLGEAYYRLAQADLPQAEHYYERSVATFRTRDRFDEAENFRLIDINIEMGWLYCARNNIEKAVHHFLEAINHEFVQNRPRRDPLVCGRAYGKGNSRG